MNKGIDIVELDKCIKKIQVFQKQESFLLDDLRNVLTSINYNYSTSNTTKLEKVGIDVSNKIKTLKKIHDEYITILYKNIEKYKNVLFKVETNFKNIGD